MKSLLRNEATLSRHFISAMESTWPAKWACWSVKGTSEARDMLPKCEHQCAYLKSYEKYIMFVKEIESAIVHVISSSEKF